MINVNLFLKTDRTRFALCCLLAKQALFGVTIWIFTKEVKVGIEGEIKIEIKVGVKYEVKVFFQGHFWTVTLQKIITRATGIIIVSTGVVHLCK